MKSSICVAMDKTAALGAGRCRKKSLREKPVFRMGQKGHLWKAGWEAPTAAEARGVCRRGCRQLNGSSAKAGPSLQPPL